MPCPLPRGDPKAALLRGEPERPISAKEAKRLRAIELHQKGEPHIVIQQRLGLSKQGLQAMLKGAGLSGKSAKPVPEAPSREEVTPARPLYGDARIDAINARQRPHI